MNKINMKEIERKVLTSYFDDGIWDIMIGLLFFAFGLTLHLDFAALIGVFAAILVLLPIQGKKAITLPRYGLIKPLESQKKRYSMLAIASVVVGLLILMVIAIGNSTSIAILLRTNSLLIMGITMGILLSIVAYVLNYDRLYLFAGLFAFSFGSGEWLISLPIKMMIAGSLIFLIGLWVLFRFLQRYPKTALPEQ